MVELLKDNKPNYDVLFIITIVKNQHRRTINENYLWETIH